MNRYRPHRLLLALATAGAIALASAAPAVAATPAVYTLTGTVYNDADRDGRYSLGDLPVANATVGLYASAADAAARRSPVRTVTAGKLGTYSATKLAAGTYYPVTTVAGYRQTTVDPVTVGGLALAGVANVPTRAVTDLTATVFQDSNGNGVRDAGEPALDGKTIIFVDVLKTQALIESGELGSIDVGAAVSAAFSGSLDLGDAIHFRTTARGAPISYPDVQPGAYVILRSPFNLTLGNLLADRARVTAFIQVLSSGSADALMNLDPELLDTGDISTTPRNEYLKSFASALTRAVDTIDSAETEKYLGSDIAAQLGSASGTVGRVASILSALPATHFAVVDRWGTSWQLTGLKPKVTTDFLFGVRNPVSISGNVFSDSNSNGRKDTLELGEPVTLTAYTADGRVLATASTSALSASYKLDRLPYDTDLYLGVTGSSKPSSVTYTGAVPPALAGKGIIGTWRLAATGTVSSITQDIGYSPLSAPTATFSTVSATGTTTMTLSNRGSAAMNVTYTVNGVSAATSVPAKPLLGSAGTRSVTLTGLKPGVNTITMTWSSGPYTGPSSTVSVTR